MKQAIQKAIEGGWKKDWYFSHFNNDEVAFGDTKQDSENNPCHYLNRGQILLDPLFWQCLGKSLGWRERCIDCWDRKDMTFKSNEYDMCGAGSHNDDRKVWKFVWHSFIDHLAEGKDVEEFFNNLIK